MATMVRVNLAAPTSGATVSAAATLAVCLTDEIAVIVGTGVARHRCGSELREALGLWAEKPRSPVAVAVGSVRTFLGAPGVTADALEGAAATALGTAVPDETQIGVVVGANAAALLDRSNLLVAAITRALDAFVSTFGV